MGIYTESVKKSNGKTEKRFRFEFDRVINGERVRLAKRLPKGLSQAQADAYDRKESERIYASATGIAKCHSITVDEAIAIYFEEKGTKLRGKDKLERGLRLLKWAYGGRKIEELDEIAQEVIKRLRAEGKTDGTINTMLGNLRSACRYAAKRLKLPVPGQFMEIPAPNNERKFFIDRKQMLQLCDRMSDIRARAVVRIAFYSGMRKCEILNATERNGNFVIDDEIAKNGETRLVPINPKIRTALKYRKMIGVDALSRAFIKARERAGMPYLHFHDVRHSAASELINNKVDLYTVGAILGHKDLKSTRRYSHLATHALEEAILKIGQKTTTPRHLAIVKKAA